MLRGAKMKLRKPRSRRRGRIEIIPMIDVMFFLLATFMLASLSLQNLHSLAVDLPRGRATQLQADKALTLTVTRDGDILLNEIVVAADSAAPNGIVVQAMLRAREAGAQHFLFAVKRE